MNKHFTYLKYMRRILFAFLLTFLFLNINLSSKAGDTSSCYKDDINEIYDIPKDVKNNIKTITEASFYIQCGIIKDTELKNKANLIYNDAQILDNKNTRKSDKKKLVEQIQSNLNSINKNIEKSDNNKTKVNEIIKRLKRTGNILTQYENDNTDNNFPDWILNLVPIFIGIAIFLIILIIAIKSSRRLRKFISSFFKGNSYSTPKTNDDYFSHVDTNSKLTLKSLEKLNKTNSNNIFRLNEYCNRLSEMVSDMDKDNKKLEERVQKLENIINNSNLSPKTDPYNLNKAETKPSYNQPSYENEIVTPQNKFYVYCKNHYENKNRDFLSLFPEVFTLDLTNASDVAYNKSDNVSLIFDESERGVYNAIKIPEIDNNNYFVFYKKNNISDEDRAMRKVFNFDKEPEPQKLYSNWKISKPAKFSNNGGNNWNLLEKGDITLE